MTAPMAMAMGEASQRRQRVPSRSRDSRRNTLPSHSGQ